MNLLPLARQFVLRPLLRDKRRSSLTILSVALGVAVVIAISLAADAATGSFQSSMKSLGGAVVFVVTVYGGVDEAVMATLTALPVNAHFAPVIEEACRGCAAWPVAQPVRCGYGARSHGDCGVERNGGAARLEAGECCPASGRRPSPSVPCPGDCSGPEHWLGGNRYCGSTAVAW